MKANYFLIAVLFLITGALTFNQWRLQRAVEQMARAAASNAGNDVMETAEGKLRQAEARLNEAKVQLDIADQKLAAANAQIAQLDNRLRQLETSRRGPRLVTPSIESDLVLEPPGVAPAKRSWGPEQAVGEPDTMQSGDIATAWAPREPDGGEEWLKLEYERAVDIAEVRVRETYNPGAVSKVTAFLPNGSEIVLWEGVEPKAEAPVEMSFAVPQSVNAQSVKVYLDTKRVPGWNEIDAVELIGRDGSHQWAKQASASSTYAEPRVANRLQEATRLERF